MRFKSYKSWTAIFFAGTLLAGVPKSTPVFAQESADQPIVQSIRSLLYQGGDNSAGAAQVSSFENQEPADLVLAVIANRRALSAGVFAVQDQGRFYLPVATLANIFGFASELNASADFIEGTVLTDKDRFSINTQSNVLSYGGNEVDIPAEAILKDSVANDDIYVVAEVLEEIWPMELNVNLQTLVLEVKPDQKLPFQAFLERKQRQEDALARKDRQKVEENFPFVPFPYQAYSKPVLDVSTQFGYRAESDDVGGSLRLSGGNDLGYMAADYSASFGFSDGKFNEPENIRLRFRRENIHEGALPYNLEDFQLGDVGIRNRQLISSGIGGRGFNFSTEKQQRTGEFDRITVDGVGNPGWEVELYRNNELLEFSQVDDRGEYIFEDVPVVYGNNRLRVVLYGPQGQVEERVENYAYQSNMLRQGETAFQGGIVDANRAFLPINEREDDTRVKGLAGNVYGAYGVNRNLTTFATANLVRDNVNGETVGREYLTAGGITNLGNFLTRAEVYKEVGGGEAVDLRALSNFKGFSVNGRISAFNNFSSPSSGEGPNAKKLETELGLAKGFQTPIGALGVDVNQRFLQRQTGPSRTTYNTRLSLGTGGTRYTNRFLTDFIDDDHVQTNGTLSISSRLNRWNIRNSIGYEVHPDLDLSNLQTEFRYFENKDRRNRSTALTAGYNLNTEEKRLGLQISEDLEKFLVSAGADWSSTRGLGLSVRASTSLGPYGANEEYLARSRSFSQLGPVNALFYRDVNYDGVFDEADEPIEGAKISAGRRLSRDPSDEDGYLTELLSARSRDINVKAVEQSIEDPYLISAVPGYKIRPRPGVVHKLDFPFIETGAIDGTLFRGDGQSGLGGVVLQLLNDQGEEVKTSQTAPDGYYTFEQIPPGSYTIRSAPDDAQDVTPQFVNLTPDNLFQFGTDMLSQVREEVVPVSPAQGVPQERLVEFARPMTNEGFLNAEKIISLAKGFKEKQFGRFIQASAGNNNSVNAFRDAQTKTAISATQADIRSIRLGRHSNKERVVLDLSGPMQYTILHDEQNDVVMVEMPSAVLKAPSFWDASKAGLVQNYRTEPIGGQGVRLSLALQNGASVGDTGLLKPHAGKPQRLYIDIER